MNHAIPACHMGLRDSTLTEDLVLTMAQADAARADRDRGGYIRDTATVAPQSLKTGAGGERSKIFPSRTCRNLPRVIFQAMNL